MYAPNIWPDRPADFKKVMLAYYDAMSVLASHVLRAMGFPPHRTQNSLRFSLGMFSTEEEVDRVIAVLPLLVDRLRGLTRRTSQNAALSK